MKNYYEILGVTKSADEEEIRRKYRKLAMEYHPDRNPDNPRAEEKFKEIAEAYGVLTDPVKRKQYDLHIASGGTGDFNSGFSYSQEDILKDLFQDPRFQQLFQNLIREFQRSGLRSNPQFLRRSFFGRKGGLFMGGLFLFGSMAGPALMKGGKKVLPKSKSVLKNITSSIGEMLQVNKANKKKALPENLDVIYQTPVSEEELEMGKWTEVITNGAAGREVLKVRIPPGSRFGQKMRLKGKGRQGKSRRGDLFLHLCRKK